MKIAQAVLVAIASAEPVVQVDRSESPRHPKNRLARLNIFCDYLFNKTGWINPKRTNGLVGFCNAWSQKMEEKVNNSKCFFYNADQKPHGGPEPDVEIPPPKKYHDRWDTGLLNWTGSRKRRSDDCLKENIFEENGPAINVCDPNDPNYAHPEWYDKKLMAALDAEDCEDDCAESEDCKSNTCKVDVRGSGDKKIARLQKQGPWKGARSILTGFRKFGERYLSQCHGHRAGTHMNRRHKFILRVSDKFMKHCEHEQCSREWVENKKFKWGKKNLRSDYAGKK